MSERKQQLKDYITGAQKLRVDDAFRDDMLEQIGQYRCNTVSGVERIAYRRSRWPGRAAAIVAALCCFVGIGGYLVYQQQDALDPKLPVDSLSSSLSESSTDSWDDNSKTDPFEAKEPLLAQLAMVEEKIAAFEKKMAEDILSAEETWEKMELEAQEAVILEELCRSGELMIAHARYQETAQWVAMQVVNGTDRTITLPSYYMCRSVEGTGNIVGGQLCYENPWNLRELSPHSSMTVYCELSAAGLYNDDPKSENYGSWSSESVWGISAGEYEIAFVNALSVEAPSVLTSRFTVEKAASVTPVAPGQIGGMDMTEISAPDDNINHITMEDASKKAAFYRGSGYDNAVACSDILQYICNTNGRPDWDASGIDCSIYYIGDEGNAYVISRWERVCYVYNDAETGESHVGSLLDIGTFGETEEK